MWSENCGNVKEFVPVLFYLNESVDSDWKLGSNKLQNLR